MRRWGSVFVLLAIALVVGNAACFTYCMAQPDTSAKPCHQHGGSKSGHCKLQHDLTKIARPSVTLAQAPLAPSGIIGIVAFAVRSTADSSDLFATSPHEPIFRNSIAPLRI